MTTNERPILFSGPMVRALLAGTKTQTRRIWKMPRGLEWYTSGALRGMETGHIHDPLGPWWGHVSEVRCPYGQPGERLWIREAWRAFAAFNDRPPREITAGPVWYEAQYEVPFHPPAYGKLRHGMFMPRWASRITLEITDVRVERLHALSEADAIAEGVDSFQGCRRDDDTAAFNRIGPVDNGSFPVARYAALWESINGPGSWGANPWVRAVEFKVVE